MVIATRIYSPEPAAAAFRLEALARALAEHADVTVLTTDADGAADAAAPGLTVRRRPVLRDRAGYVRGYLPYLSFDLPLGMRLLVTRRPGVVVVEPPPTTGVVVRLVCAIRRIPYVYNAADVWSDAAGSTGAGALTVRVLRRLERWALRGAALSLSVSHGVTERVRQLGAGRVVTVGNGVDTRVFAADGETRGTGVFLVYAGTTSEWQGADVFIRALPRVLAQVPDARIVFLGQGSAWNELQELAARVAPGAVEFVPLVPPTESAAWLRGARAALVSLRPGLGYDFAFPTKVLAALATGTPVVYAGPGPAGPVIEAHGMGWRVDYDQDHVARAMVEALAREVDAESSRRFASWVEEHRSLHAVARQSAAAVLAVAQA